MSSASSVEKKFCASPWVEGVFRLHGMFQPCCRSNYPYGNWRRDGLEASWSSEQAMDFRAKITAGEFPSSDCKSCYNNGQAGSLKSLVLGPLNSFMAAIHKIKLEKVHELHKIRLLLDPGRKHLDEEAKAVLHDVYRTIAELVSLEPMHEEYRELLGSVRTIAEIIEDYLAGELRPRHVAPFRQSNVIAVCNARCVQCPGLFTGEISEGLTTKVPTLTKEKFRMQTYTELTRDDIDITLQRPDSIIDFFANGSELLFLKEWRLIADRLRKRHIKLRVSTNGMLLTRKNVQYLIDKDIVRKMNISLDATSPELMEQIRVRVKYDRVVDNIKYLINYCNEKEYQLPLTFSFCMMKINYHELPGFVGLVRQLVGDSEFVQPSIMIQALSLKGHPDYEQFVESHHHSLIERDDLRVVFEELQSRAKSADVPVRAFFKYSLEEFLEQGLPFPEHDWSPQATRRAPVIKKAVLPGVEPEILEIS